ncbi:alpha/beta fold hydrolase (plasmid) [Deinococcus sp. KNUC1210]|uniref:alpha/beta fold hydrolase n=1 Tax=Deinococcus sp. KNUC1210 TaxID=2917691 RepID=UPI001EF12089|nr:alpha/beta fold hydrolase [Deinococcus sp. KNUC1210]ULH17312.1 alpha/beta fold hydrolase [Deinococcus sp. KNUC1210]
MPGQFLNVGDTRLFAEVRGPASLPPLIVLHGGPGLDHHEFADFLDPLTDTVRLVLLDLRAQGESDRDAPESSWTLAQMADDVQAAAQALGAPHYAVLGHSYGAFVALQQAVNAQETRQGMAGSVVCCGVPSSRFLDGVAAELERFEPPQLREQIRASWAGEADVATEADFARLMEEQMPWHFADPLDPRIADYTRRSAGRYAPDVLRRFASAGYGGIEVMDDLGKVERPMLVLAGRHDRTCPPEASEVTAAGVPGAQLHVFEDSGHMPFVEQPDEFLTVVRAFLRRVLPLSAHTEEA